MTESLVSKADSVDLGAFFRLDLFWSAPDHAPIEVEFGDGTKLTATNVSSYKGVRVWEVPSLPGSAVEAHLDQVLARISTNRLVVFRDGERQIWRWPSRSTKDSGVISRPARHKHQIGSPDTRFEAKLDAIRLPSNVQIDVNDLLARVRGAFDVETKNETKRASKLMAQMYAAIEKGYASGSDPKRRDHEISVTLARILFLLFCDDTEMWKSTDGEPVADLFQDFVKDHAKRDGSDIAKLTNALFKALNTASPEREDLVTELAAFPYVNGGIFEEEIVLPTLDGDFRKAILDASAVDWSTISPAIFGSMFQSVRDADTRRSLGEHYTSEENILKTLNPLFLDELRAEYGAAINRDTVQKQINALNVLWKKLGSLRFMDPACGCGNFIIVAYRELRALELEIMGALADLQEGQYATTLDADWTHLLKVTLDSFYGIEIDEWPARIAETAMFLMDRQCDLKMKERFGVAPERLPLQKAAKIVVGSALQLNWSEIVTPAPSVVVAGNPPFLGHKERSRAQGDELKTAWNTNNVQHLDYVTAWYAKSLAFFGSIDGRWAFVSTNSVTQGEGVSALFRPILSAGWKIKFAHRSFKWTSDATGAAAVHVIIAGFERAPRSVRLFNYPTGTSQVSIEFPAVNINPYLIDGPLRELSRSPILAKRIAAVKSSRESSDRVPTKKLALTPHLFGERRQPSADYLGIPQTFSDSRKFATAARVPASSIASIKLFTHADPDGFLFALVSSSMFITWQKTIGGRLKSDPSFSSSLVWNTFPVPAVSSEERSRISEFGAKVLAARENHHGKTLAELYKPEAMPIDLVAAHEQLDVCVDSIFGLSHEDVDFLERQETLFAKYLTLSSGLLADPLPKRPGRRGQTKRA